MARAKREAPKGEARREGAVCRRALAVSDSPLERVSRWLGVGNGFVSGSGEINDSGKGVSIVWTRDACFGMKEENADAVLGNRYHTDCIDVLWAVGIVHILPRCATAIPISTK